MQNLKALLKNKDGATLVGAIAIALILSVAGVAYAILARNTVSNEVDAHNDLKAFLTAEAGLLVGTSWVKEVPNWEFIEKHTGVYVLQNVPPINEDIFATHVTLEWFVDGTEEGVLIKSRAIENTGLLPYTKELQWKVSRNYGGGETHGLPGLMVNVASDSAWAGGSSNNSGGIHHGANFFGPVHFNTPIFIYDGADSDNGNNNPLRFFGPVTVFDDSRTYNSFGEGRRIPVNVYDKGIIITNNAVKDWNGERLDNVFQSTYKYGDVRLGTEFNAYATEITPDNRIWLGDVMAAPPYNMTVPTAANQHVALDFGNSGGTPRYRIKIQRIENNGNITVLSETPWIPYTTAPTAFFAGTQNDYNVGAANPSTTGLGFPLTINASDHLTGRVTVKTPYNHDLTFNLGNGNLLYSGVSVAEASELVTTARDGGKTEIEGNHLFAFYSGGNVNINASGQTIPALGGNPLGHTFITAQVFAYDKKKTNAGPTDNSSGTFIINGDNSNHRIHVFGAAVMNRYWNTNSSNDKGVLHTYYDSRTDANGKPLSAPGVNVGQLDDNGNIVDPNNPVSIFFTPHSWREVNHPKGATS